MAQMRNQLREDGECAIPSMGESYLHVDLGQAMEDLTEAEGVLLMDLMEDDDVAPSDMPDGDVDRLSHVIRSLEAEISGGGGNVAVRVVDGESMDSRASIEDGVVLDDMLLDLDHYAGGSFGYWPEASLIGHDEAGGLYVYSSGYEGGVVGYEAIDHQYHCCVEGSAEQQVYCPLWE